MKRKQISAYTPEEKALFKKLNTPAKIQDYLDTVPINFERGRETCFSPRSMLLKKRAHCMEGALFAACVLQYHGFPPLVLDLRATKDDYDHVVAVFKARDYYGAISKTNHATLRYREPVYTTPRELALSYFHEYFDNKTGKKNLREFSSPVDLSRFNARGWQTDAEDVFYIPDYLDTVKHYDVVPKDVIRLFRKADAIEVKAGKLLEWSDEGKRKSNM